MNWVLDICIYVSVCLCVLILSTHRIGCNGGQVSAASVGGVPSRSYPYVRSCYMVPNICTCKSVYDTCFYLMCETFGLDPLKEKIKCLKIYIYIWIYKIFTNMDLG